MSDRQSALFGRAIHRATALLRMRGVLSVTILALGLSAPAWAFDAVAYKAGLDTTIEELKTKSLSNSAATLARLDELIAAGSQAAREFGVKRPKFAPLMAALVKDVPAMKAMTGNELEDKWGETGAGGDGVGIPLKSLGQWNEERNHIELVTAPTTAYVLVKKWTSAQKAHWLDDAREELTELVQHFAKL